ncbi:hypothetical protein [Muninn virus]|nr:hypothetical protein [Muninn virus]
MKEYVSEVKRYPFAKPNGVFKPLSEIRQITVKGKPIYLFDAVDVKTNQNVTVSFSSKRLLGILNQVRLDFNGLTSVKRLEIRRELGKESLFDTKYYVKAE